MADNFNLRAFLSENKLTKNAQLLKEQEDYKYFDEEGTGGFYMTTIDGVQIYSLEDSSVADTCFYALVEPETTYMISIDVSGEPVDADYVEQDSGVTGKVAEFIANDINKELGQEGGEDLNEAQFSDSYDTPAAKKVHGQLTDIVDIFEKSRDQETQELNAAIDAAEQQTGTQVTPTERRVLQQQASWIRMRRSEMEREGTENKKPIMKETKLTAKERRLVEMVQAAMGYPEEGEDEFNPADAEDEKDYRRDQYRGNQMEEGEDMVQEKPMPKYESIDQLMKEIEHGTNEAAHKYKMEEMKRIYELLETKVTSLEEGENAEHIDQSKVKQMRKDIAALRKAEEKLRKEFEKKFTEKEKKEAPKKVEKEAATEAATEALQEGFDLRKFLVENRK